MGLPQFQVLMSRGFSCPRPSNRPLVPNLHQTGRWSKLLDWLTSQASPFVYLQVGSYVRPAHLIPM